jgi:hypothetical protein
MTGLVRKATLFGACGLLLAGSAMAAVPSPANSTIPTHIRVVASNAGVADPLGNFSVNVRDLANNPVANSSVVIDFTGCEGKVCQATSLTLGQVVDCVTNTVRSVSDISGNVSFNVLGADGIVPPKPVGPGVGCASILADGVNLGPVTVIYHDPNGLVSGGSDGMNITDTSSVLGDIFVNGIFVGRSDFDESTTLSIVDFSFALTAALGTGGASSAGCVASGSSYCP